MTYDAFIQTIVYGLQTGITYILVALGFTLIFSILGIINLAHGEIYMLGAFAVYYLVTALHVNYFVALLLGMLIVGIFGIFLERVIFRPVQGSDMVVTIIIITGLMLIIQGSAQIVFGTASRGMADIFTGSFHLFGATLSILRGISMLISLALLAALYFFVYRTKQGRAMQAVAQNREAAILQGVRINQIHMMGFGLSCALAAAAGGLMAPIYFIDATMGGTILFSCLAIIILGGIGSIPGAALGGLILGLVQSLGLRFLGYASTTFPFIIIIIILLVKRTGLLGKGR
jgi:branched-chain amino acid transport system permease protein